MTRRLNPGAVFWWLYIAFTLVAAIYVWETMP